MFRVMLLAALVLFTISLPSSAEQAGGPSHRSSAQRIESALQQLIHGRTTVPQAASVVDVRSYFPLHDGDTKYYTSEWTNVTLSYMADMLGIYSGFAEYDTADGSRTYYGYSGDKVVMYGALLSGSEVVFDAPLAMFDQATLAQGGTYRSSTSGTLLGYQFTVSVLTTVTNAGDVTVPAGTFQNCREVAATITLSAVGETETVTLPEVWVLAPGVGKLKIAVADQFLNVLGWAELTRGTANGEVIDGSPEPLPDPQPDPQPDPLPDVKANGSDGPVTLSSTEALRMSVSLESNRGFGQNADWWAVADTPLGWFHFDATSGEWASGLAVSYQGPLFNFGATQVLDITGLPTGQYTLYFGVDMPMDGALSDDLYYDSVVVTVTD